MANGDYFDNFLLNGSNYSGGEIENYEDTHDAAGNYVGRQNARPQPQPGFGQSFGFAPQQPIEPQQPSYTPPPTVSAAAQRTESTLGQPTRFAHVASPEQRSGQPIPLPGVEQYISPQLNSNFVIYQPRTTADVERLIAYLRRREPALVDLEPMIGTPEAQRLMDFTAGAAFALGETVMTVRRNLFLITPDTIEVLKPETESGQN